MFLLSDLILHTTAGQINVSMIHNKQNFFQGFITSVNRRHVFSGIKIHTGQL